MLPDPESRGTDCNRVSSREQFDLFYQVSHVTRDGHTVVVPVGRAVQRTTYTLTLVSVDHLSATFPLILYIPACQYKTVRTSSSPAWTQFVIVPLYLQEIPTSSAFLTSKHALMVKASSPAWLVLSAKTSAVQLSSSESWHNVCSHSLSFMSGSH